MLEPDAFTKLTSILTPPKKPLDVGDDSSWNLIERQLGISFPTDYKKFLSIYGSGSIDQFLSIFNPLSHDPAVRFFERSNEKIDAVMEMREADPDFIKFPIYPEVGGWLPWGTSPNNNIFYWVTNGAPDAWTIAVAEGHGPWTIEWNLNFVQFLLSLITGGIRCEFLDPYFPNPSGSSFDAYN